MWIKDKQQIIETFNDGSPKLVHITKNILGRTYITRSIEFWGKNKIRYDKQYMNGRPEGKQLFFSETGKKTEQWIKNCKRDGIYSQWNEKSELILTDKSALFNAGKGVVVVDALEIFGFNLIPRYVRMIVEPERGITDEIFHEDRILVGSLGHVFFVRSLE